MTDRPRIPTVDEARQYLERFNFFARYAHGPEEGDVYVAAHARRFVETLKRVPQSAGPPKVLELGAVPYSMTILLRHCLDADVDTLSFYEIEDGPNHHVLESPDGLETYQFDYRPINVERDPFPGPDGMYDVVLCCELLEHVLINPSHMFFETHRVLKPGGFVVVTTPNVARAANVRALTEGRNIYDAYHGNGIYGRHNREYTAAEVSLLLESCGFDISHNETLDVYDSTEPGSAPGREDTIIAIAQAVRTRRIGTPPSLYVLMNEYVNIVRPAIAMGIDEVGHLGRGWYDLEHDGELTFRWTARQATFHLQTDCATSIGIRVQAHHPDLLTRPVRISVAAGGRSLGDAAIEDHAWRDLEFPMEKTSGPLEIKVSVDREWVPHDASGSGDHRRLGLCFARCWSH